MCEGAEGALACEEFGGLLCMRGLWGAAPVREGALVREEFGRLLCVRGLWGALMHEGG